MSEAPKQADQMSVSEGDVASTPQPTAGALLRQAREAAGLHVAALAVSLKVPVKKLEALEANRFAELPDAVFVRALAGSVCRALKVDPTPILALLPQSAKPQLHTDEVEAKTTFRTPGTQQHALWRDWLSRPGPLLTLGLVLAALLLVFWPVTPEAPPSAAVVLPAAPVSPGVDAALAVPDQTTASPASGLPEASVVPPVASPGAPVQTPSTQPLLGAALPVAASPVAGAVQPVASSSGELARPAAVAAAGPVVAVSFKARATTWVAVTDARGESPLRRSLSAGETVSVSGPAPLSVVVGRVDATAVEVRGQVFNLDAVARDNVARFEVK